MLQLETHNFYYNYAKNVPLIRRGRLSISKEIRSIVTTLVRNILHRTIRHKFPATMEIIQKVIGCQKKRLPQYIGSTALGTIFVCLQEILRSKYVIAWLYVSDEYSQWAVNITDHQYKENHFSLLLKQKQNRPSLRANN